MENNERTIKYQWPIPYKPENDFEDMRQRDMAAESARQWAGRQDLWVDVVAINRGRKNLIVELVVR